MLCVLLPGGRGNVRYQKELPEEWLLFFTLEAAEVRSFYNRDEVAEIA